MAKGNLLIVDDEVMLLNNLTLNLQDYADEIYTAENGKEALTVCHEKIIHCIVCDINMPIMNGVQFIKKLREENNNVPFIFFTGHGSQELMMEAVQYGAFDFLDKPNFDGLEEVVERGLHAGLDGGGDAQPQDDESFVTEYQKILDSLNKK
jgi:DNA-binding NtrC family response regulator